MGKISLGKANSKYTPAVVASSAVEPISTIVETIKEVPVPYEVAVEVIKEVPVPYEVRVPYNVYIETVKEVPVETIKEVYIVKEVPVEVIKTHTVYDIENTMIEKQKVVALEKKSTRLQLVLIIMTLICVGLGVHNV